MSNQRYWLVMHNADTTETGLPMNKTYVKTTWEGFPTQQFAEREILETFLFSRFGDRVAYVQGVAPTPNWALHESNKEVFEEAQPIVWGGYPTKTVRLELGIGDHGKVNVYADQET